MFEYLLLLLEYFSTNSLSANFFYHTEWIIFYLNLFIKLVEDSDEGSEVNVTSLFLIEALNKFIDVSSRD
jgi:hypothetical protein